MTISKTELLKEFYTEFTNLINVYYPRVLDHVYGGYLTNFSFNWGKMLKQEKMIVTQARHIWTASKASELLDDKFLQSVAEHGIDFLRDKMWDKTKGGFFQIRDQKGGVSDSEGWYNEKRVYGNAFGVFGLAALYGLTKNEAILEFAKEAFNWIEDNAFDAERGGYYQFFTEENIVFDKSSEYKTNATDAKEVGFKDQNSSIHLLEAYTELYHHWKDDKLRDRLNSLLLLIRETILNEKGYLNLFFEYDWTPVSFKDASEKEREQNYRLDHVSFGHDYETAFLMLEASYVLGIENDHKTFDAAKKMADHAIKYGWDEKSGGFFDEGYYFDKKTCRIINKSKTWWAQAEALNIYLILYLIYEKEKYWDVVTKTWDHIKKYIIDQENGDWFWGSTEKEPHHITAPKSSIWKGTYHNARALMNCIVMLSNTTNTDLIENKNMKKIKEKNTKFIKHWKNLIPPCI